MTDRYKEARDDMYFADSREAISKWYDKYYHEIRQALSSMIEGGWKTMESAPRGDDFPYSKVSENPATFVLIYNGHHIGCGYCMLDDSDGEYRWFSEDGNTEPEPTHWQPLPAAPEGESDE